jgi:hypothetical protein
MTSQLTVHQLLELAKWHIACIWGILALQRIEQCDIYRRELRWHIARSNDLFYALGEEYRPQFLPADAEAAVEFDWECLCFANWPQISPPSKASDLYRAAKQNLAEARLRGESDFIHAWAEFLRALRGVEPHLQADLEQSLQDRSGSSASPYCDDDVAKALEGNL